MTFGLVAWNFVDAILILVILFYAWRGWWRGFILGTRDLLAWAGALLSAFRFYAPLGHRIAPLLGGLASIAEPLAFLLIAITGNVALSLAGIALIRRMSPDVHRRNANRVLGLLPGLVNGAISAVIIATLLIALPLPRIMQAAARASAIGSRLVQQSQHAEALLAPVFGDAIKQTLDLLTIKPESNERVALPFRVADTTPRPDLEAQMLVLVNDERAKAGLRLLSADEPLRATARRHSADMFARGYFAHVNPEGLNPFDRMHAAGIDFLLAGENLALASTLTLAHQGLMNSPGHRANIMRPQFGRVGIGILDGGIRGIMVTQEFRD